MKKPVPEHAAKPGEWVIHRGHDCSIPKNFYWRHARQVKGYHGTRHGNVWFYDFEQGDDIPIISGTFLPATPEQIQEAIDYFESLEAHNLGADYFDIQKQGIL